MSDPWPKQQRALAAAARAVAYRHGRGITMKGQEYLAAVLANRAGAGLAPDARESGLSRGEAALLDEKARRLGEEVSREAAQTVRLSRPAPVVPIGAARRRGVRGGSA